MAPTEFHRLYEGFHQLVCDDYLDSHPERTKAAQNRAREFTGLIQTEHCEHVRLSVAFSLFGCTSGDKPKLWAGVRYAEEDPDKPELHNFRLRFLKRGSFSERRVIESAAFVIREFHMKATGRSVFLSALPGRTTERQAEIGDQEALASLLLGFGNAIWPLLKPESLVPPSPESDHIA